jgi:hypothetical protein
VIIAGEHDQLGAWNMIGQVLGFADRITAVSAAMQY